MVVAAVFSMFATFGVAYSFNAFFPALSEEFGASKSGTSLFFSFTVCLSFLFGLITGRWVDKVGPRKVLLAGAASLVIGLLATAAAPSIWFGYVTYGLGVGFAMACGYVPMVATVGGWFEKRRASALGVAVAGIGLGTMIGSPLAAWLIGRTSWRTTFVYFAIGGGLLMLAAAALASTGPATTPAAKPKSLIGLLRNPVFTLLYISMVFASFSLFVPFVFLGDFASDNGVDEVQAAALVGVIGGASILGRLALGSLGDKLDPLTIYEASFVLMALSHLIWLLGGGSYIVLLFYSVLLGVGYGGFIALSPAVAAKLFGMEGLGGVIGTLYTAAAIGALGGPPLAGLLIEQFNYTAAIGFAVAAASVSWLVLRALAIRS